MEDWTKPANGYNTIVTAIAAYRDAVDDRGMRRLSAAITATAVGRASVAHAGCSCTGRCAVVKRMSPRRPRFITDSLSANR